ncbi:hypothetical protein [Longimicrobium sp.]|uniref:hypothetical protein n=1 Tax=Longimicrobium sp. TaxID=2029185 RepID=UPI002E363241|nr:hypothetical protein [Longimicrobium sp.]HEX6039487.1 hypothetical protein [Longimicrobium sp.]
MRESDMPPPGDPAVRGSRVWAYLFIAAILVFIAWFAAEHWSTRQSNRNTTVPVQSVDR